MIRVNEHYLKLKSSYLFSDIAKEVIAKDRAPERVNVSNLKFAARLRDGDAGGGGPLRMRIAGASRRSRAAAGTQKKRRRKNRRRASVGREPGLISSCRPS